jgi:hypothetical protein
VSTPTVERTNAPFPGAGGSGMIETVKRAVVVALRDAISGTTLSGMVNGSDVTVDMEYPMKKEHYPGIWVQFSFNEMVNAGVSHEIIQKTIGEDQQVNWEPIREFQFKGRVSLTIVALTSLERDRLSDSVISMLMFSRPPEYVLTKPDEDTKQFRQLISSLAQNPYISMTINHDELIPGGQSMTTGVPWDEEIPGYEDTYSFDILGQANIVFLHDGTYSLRNIRDAGELEAAPSRYDWQ